MDDFLSQAKEYGLPGFILVLWFSTIIVFLKWIGKFISKMIDAMENNAKTMAELKEYLRGRNGR